MLRITTIMMLTLAAAVSRSAFGQNKDDWKYYGWQENGSIPTKPVDWFYLANQIHQLAGGTFLVWTEALNAKAVADHIDNKIVARSLLAMKGGYFPPYYLRNSGPTDTLADRKRAARLLGTVVADEQVADEATLTPKLRLLVQMDCTNQRYQLMSVVGTMNGQAIDSNTPEGWEYIPPDSTLSALVELMCVSKSGGKE